jgi:hypothetical protein
LHLVKPPPQLQETAVNGTALHDGKLVGAADEPPVHLVVSPPTESLHVTHGLVAIANGPDYCLCGRTWPCDERVDETE